jgi:hypothetical protein
MAVAMARGSAAILAVFAIDHRGKYNGGAKTPSIELFK